MSDRESNTDSADGHDNDLFRSLCKEAKKQEHNIDITCLDGLGDEELKLLIPDNKLRDRIKFKQGLKKYKDEVEIVHSNTDSLDTDTLSLSSCDFLSDASDISNKHKLNIHKILSENMRGRQALQAIKKKELDSSSRNDFGHSIVEYYIKHFQKMTRVHFETIANEIVELCPTECKETYYVPSRSLGNKNTMPAKGKLVDRYYNQTRILRKSGVLPQKRKLSSSSHAELSDGDNMDHDTDTDQQWLKVNRDPWTLVEEKWSNSCAYRKKKTYDSDATTLATITNEWPCLKTTNGHRLIEIDFTYLYPERNLNLFQKWNSFQATTTKLMEDDVVLNENLRTLLKSDNENTRDFALCSLLAFKMKPTSKIMKSEKNKFYKVSIAESSQAFVMNVNSNADLVESLRNRHKSYNRKGLTCQPIIVCVGLPTAFEAFYVVVDDIKYRFESLTKALDVCFKCFMVLNLAYPKECEQLWLFIQKYFYEIQLPSDNKFSQVSTFIRALTE